MQPQFKLDQQPAKLTAMKLRAELKDDRGLPDICLNFECHVGKETLAGISPDLGAFLFKKDPQEDAFDATGNALRFPELEPLSLDKKITGAVFVMHFGAGEVNGVSTEPKSEETQIDTFTVEPQEGGYVVLRFRVWGKFTGPQIASLALTLGRDTHISASIPEPAQQSLIDGSGDGDWKEPEASTGDEIRE